MNRGVPKGLIIILILIGVAFICWPIVEKNIYNNKYKEYIETTATFIQSNKSVTDEDGKQLYNLTYLYIVDGNEHYYTTNYSTNNVPKIGSKIRIKYNAKNPDMVATYEGSFYMFFQLLGAFLIFISLEILFFNIIWLRDIIIFLFTGTFISVFIVNKFYTVGSIIAILIFFIMFFASIVDFIHCSIEKKIEPLNDIKREIEISRSIRRQKIEEKRNLTEEQINLRNKKVLKIIEAVLLILIPAPIVILIDINVKYPNDAIQWMIRLIPAICMFISFYVIYKIFTMKPGNGTILIAGKSISDEVIKNKNNMTLKQKIKAFNVLGIILRLLFIPAFVVTGILILEDPLHIFEIFKNKGIAQIITLFSLVFLIDIIYIKKRKKY